ncbi:MAG: UbiD family decarboxylase, partial [Planctomycetales bacterium]
MRYRSLRECVNDLQRAGLLIRVATEVDPHLEIAEIQRRVFQAGGPAVYFEQVKGCEFPVVCNLFGTAERMRFIFRGTLKAVRRFVQLKTDPGSFRSRPWNYPAAMWSATS